MFGAFAVQDINPHKKGQGRGLSIAKQVVALHGGRIEVRSSRGEGASFSILLSKCDVVDV